MKPVFGAFKISHKLFVSSLTFAFPITLLVYFMVSGINANIHFARLESWGNQVLQPLNELVGLIPRHQLLATLFQAGDASVERELNTTADQIQQAFATLEQATAKFGGALQIDEEGLRAANMGQYRPAALFNAWNALRNALSTLGAEQLAQTHAELTKNVRGLISRVGDTSKLILDPDLDSYYIMDMVLLAMPQAQNRVGDLLLFGRRVFAQPALSDDDRLSVGIQAAMQRETEVTRIQQDSATALREDQNFYGISPSLQENLPPALKRYTEEAFKFMTMLDGLSRAKTLPLTFDEFRRLSENVLRAGSALWQSSSQELGRLLERRIASYQRTRLLYLGLSLCALLLASVSVLLISHGITNRLTKVITMTAEIAQGNLTVTFAGTPAKDEIGQLLTGIQGMIRNLNALISRMQQSGIKVSSSATELVATTRQQEATVKVQVESANKVLQSVEEIAGVADKLVQTMQGVAFMAENPAALTNDQQTDLARMAEAMQRMEAASRTISGRLQAINEHAENITKIVTTITKVADQTNLLSLNAAIEAEKAGEYGRGFTVVAREIRRLADQTAVATLDIEQMVREMQAAVSSGVMEMDKFINEVRQSAEDVTRVSAKLFQIIQQVQALSPRFEDVNGEMVNLHDGMRQTSESLSETFLAIGQLNEAAKGLQDEVTQFKVD